MTAGILNFLIGVSIQITSIGGDPASIEAVAEKAPAGSQLTLHRIDGDTAGAAMFSRVEIDGNSTRLIPSFRLSPDEHYVVRLVSKAGGILSEQKYQVPGKLGEAPKVVRVIPECRVLPANLLKFYIQFDQPMREGKAVFDGIQILDGQGQTVGSPWRRQEIWSDDAKRLTLWIHPGRVKQGVNLRVELGPVLKPYKRYTLIVSRNLIGQSGVPISKEHQFRFETSSELNERVRVEDWKLQLPVANSTVPIEIQTPRAMDVYLMQRHVQIFDSSGTRIDTKISWERDQARFRFVPNQPWGSGEYQVHISEYLEDLSGNTPTRAFDQVIEAKDKGQLMRRIKFSL